jgi:hypothetical protein
MKSEDQIEKLFEGEELPSETPTEKKHPLISLFTKSEEAESGGIERREYNRAEIADRKLELKFANSSQFARQYIENISLGGVFVKTEEKRALGEVLPIEFTIPTAGELKQFSFRAKVCRVSSQGLGLEFIGVNQQIQDELEAFVKTVLPKNISVTSKAKNSTVDRLKMIREQRAVRSEEKKVFWKKVSLIGILLLLNGYLVHETIQTRIAATAIRTQSVHVNGQDIPVSNIRGIQRNQNGEWLLNLDNKSSISVQPEAIEGQLPVYLQHTLHLLQTTPMRKEIRRSKNTHGLSTMH